MKFEKSKFFLIFILVFVLVEYLIAQENQVYVCPLAKSMEEINPRCECRIDLILGETVTSTCSVNGQSYEMTLTITEYEGKEYYTIYGFENGGAGVNLKPEAKISGNFEGRVGEILNFSAFQSFDPNGDPLEFYWDFGDGSYANGKDVSHTYNSTGKYLLKLKVSDGLAFSTATTTVTISEKLTFGGTVILSPSIEKRFKENVKEESTKKQTKFLAPPISKDSFKIPVERESEKKETGKEEISLKIEKEIKKPIQKEAFLATLREIVKGKIPIYFFVFTFLLVAIFGILKVKNYFWSKKKL